MIEMIDSIIVGGSVSGLVSAILLSKKGFKVILLEKEKEIGMHTNYKIDVTESTNLENILNSINIEIPFQSSNSRWHSPEFDLLIESKVKDYFVFRGNKDNCIEVKLKDNAIKNNVIIETGLIVKGIELKKECIEVKMKDKKLNAKTLIVADGSNSNTRQLLGLNNFKKIKEFHGFGAIMEDINLNELETNIYFDQKIMPGGYFYAARMPDGEGIASIVTTSNDKIKDRFELLKKNNEKINDLMKNAKIKNFFAGSSFSGILKNRVKGNALLTGDAALTLSPVFGYGVNTAIRSAFLAAESIEKKLEFNESLENYELKLKKANLVPNREAIIVNKIYSKLENNDLDFILKQLSQILEKTSIDELLESKTKLLMQISKILFLHPLVSFKILAKII